jgi:chromosome partitioning protein
VKHQDEAVAETADQASSAEMEQHAVADAPPADHGEDHGSDRGAVAAPVWTGDDSAAIAVDSTGTTTVLTAEAPAAGGDSVDPEVVEDETADDDAESDVADEPEAAGGPAEAITETTEPAVEPPLERTATGTASERPASGFDESTPLARELAEITRRRQLLSSQDLPLPTKTRIFTVANQKGGVGKTTTTVNLAAALARTGARVLVIDLDPQGNASTALGVEHRSETPSVYEVIINDLPMASVVQKSPEFEALYCIPATIHLAGAEIELVSLVAREQRLRSALETFLEESDDTFHYVFIDCPPSLGLLTINAFVAANEVLIPIQCEYYALEGLSQLLNNIQLIERHLNPTLNVSTILLTMYDARTNLANHVVQDVREHFPNEVLQTLIPRSVRISEAPSYGQSVISYDTNSPGSLSYLEAAAEIARRGAPN